ncbi:MAG: uracil-DNA glycosylase, partial [Betaproteobacteria bacterium]
MSLDLDPRQRAMLQEMGVKVWSPLPQFAATEALQACAEIAATVERSAQTPAQQERTVPAVRPAAVPAAAAPGAAAPGAAAMALQPRVVGVERMDWPTLQQAVCDCRACALCSGRKHTVFGMGGLRAPTADQPPLADWLIVGEAPGEQEDLVGVPFV